MYSLVYVHFPQRLICTHLQRYFPQGYFLIFSATHYVSDFYSSGIICFILSLMFILKFHAAEDSLIEHYFNTLVGGRSNNHLRVIYLALYSAGSWYQIYSKASQHWISLSSHGLPYTTSPWEALQKFLEGKYQLLTSSIGRVFQWARQALDLILACGGDISIKFPYIQSLKQFSVHC